MREIKFRFWDKVNQQMRYMGLNSVIGWERASLDIMMLTKGTPLKRQLDKCIYLQQYTGLKDKLGKEIYEGDIVGSYSSIGVVKYGECFINGQEYDCWGFYLDDEDKELLRYSEQKYSDYKIIGNIYESPELLRKDIQ